MDITFLDGYYVQPGLTAEWIMVQPTDTQSLILWVGTALMALGTVALIAMGWGEKNERKQEFYIITIFITAIASVSYFSMATGYGLIEVPVGGETLDIYWARYADWLFTTPLLLLDIALLAGADRNTIATLVGLDVAMILTGLAGALARSSALNRMLWWGISTAFMIAVLFLLVRTLSGQAARQSSAVAATFSRLRTMILVLRSLYPVVWVLGTESTIGALSLTQETIAFAILDVTAKVGFGFVLLRSRDALEDVSTSAQAAD